MSDVKYSKRKKSRLEAQHMAYAIRKRITVELMASFALSQKRIEAYVESATKGIADISEREVTAKLLRELTMDRNVWFITKEILKEAANTRKVFVEGILSGRIPKVTDESKIEAELFEQMMDWETFTGHNKLIEFFVGCEVYNAPEEEKEAARKKMQGLSVLQKLLCLVSAMVADADLVEWNYTYNTVKGEKVKAFYGILEQYGFQFPNDEEKGVVEGTSDLYVKKEGAK